METLCNIRPNITRRMNSVQTPYLVQSNNQYSTIRKTTLQDTKAVYELYKAVTAFHPGALAQEQEEVTLSYVRKIIESSIQRGISFVVERNGEILAFVKTFTSEFRCFAHVLADSTLMVSPSCRSAGYGAILLKKVLQEIEQNMPYILRLEIIAFSKRTADMYKKFGFEFEKDKKSRFRNIDGSLADELNLVWFNRNFSIDALVEYHSYLLHMIKKMDSNYAA